MKGSNVILTILAVSLMAITVLAEDANSAVSGWVTPTTTTMGPLCADSDGGVNLYVKGVARGTNGEKTDSCLGSRKLQEWECKRDMIISSIQVCPQGCDDGACKGESSSVTTTTIRVLTATSTTTTTQKTTTTMPENNVATSSTTTTTLPSTTTTLKREVVESTTTTTLRRVESKCTDSDGGKNYYVKGVANGTNGEKSDVCLGGKKGMEWFCKGDMIVATMFVCSNGCVDGACKIIGTTTTSTSTTTTSSTTTTTKATQTTTTLANDVETTTTLQESGASTGCFDSDDGKNFAVKGTASGGNGRKDDKCMDQVRVAEAYCDGRLVRTEIHDCEKGCYRGACR